MTEPAVPQQPEGLATGVIGWVGAGVVVISAALIAVAWLLVVPPPEQVRPAVAPSPLTHALFDQPDQPGQPGQPAGRADDGAASRAAGEQRLRGYAWVDRAARVVRIPIDRAIDAVAADPRLIGASSKAIVGAAAGTGVPSKAIVGAAAGTAAPSKAIVGAAAGTGAPPGGGR